MYWLRTCLVATWDTIKYDFVALCKDGCTGADIQESVPDYLTTYGRVYDQPSDYDAAKHWDELNSSEQAEVLESLFPATRRYTL